MGTGCVLIQREVFAKLNPPFFEYGRHKEYWNKYRGEDTYFFNKCKEAGFSLFVDTGAQCGHISEMIINTDMARTALKQQAVIDNERERKELLDDGQD